MRELGDPAFEPDPVIGQYLADVALGSDQYARVVDDGRHTTPF